MTPELERVGIFHLCNCPICITFVGTNSSKVYRLSNTNFYYRILFGDATWWMDCPRRFSSRRVDFDDVFELLDEEIQNKVLFNLNLFKKTKAILLGG